MTAPTMPEIRQAIERARALDGREDTEEFTLAAPRLLAQLVRILDLYIGHEPTLAEESEYVRAEVRREVLAEAKVETVAWLVKKAAEQATWDAAVLASKIDRGAVRAFLGTGHYRDAMDAHRAMVLAEAADLAEQWQNEADDAAAEHHGGLTDTETAAHIAVRRVAKRLRETAGKDNQAAPDFFQPNWIYTRQHHGEPILFWVSHVTAGPGMTHPTAFGWRKKSGEDWEPTDSDDMDGWTRVVEGSREAPVPESAEITEDGGR